jgi:glutamate-ammonia-ligase adenylyltransferase
MALTRARPIFGSPQARADVQAVIDDVLAGHRPQRDIAGEARKMRADMAAHKPPQGPLDAKLAPGGLVDLEFAVHVAQLVHHAGFDPGLDKAIALLAAQQLVPAALGPAYAFLTRLLVAARLLAPDGEPPAPATRALIARGAGVADWDAVVATLAATRQEVLAAWTMIGGHDDDR